MAKLYRVYKHYDREYNHIYIEIITDKGYYETRRIFTIKWQQTTGEQCYYGFNYEFTGRKDIDLFYSITRKLEKTNQIHYDTQPYNIISTLEEMGYRQCEYYNYIGFTEIKKVKNKNNFVYNMNLDGNSYTTRLANKRTYKKDILKKTRITQGEVKFKISDLNDGIKNTKCFDLKQLYKEYVMCVGTEEEKKKLIREEKLERICTSQI